MRIRLLALVALLSMFNASVALADPFEGTELLVGRSVKQPKGAKRFAAGLNFQFAPVNVLAGYLSTAAVDLIVDQACPGGDTACQTQTKEAVDTAIVVIDSMSDDQWDQVKGVLSGETSGETLDTLKDTGVISDKEYDAAQTYNKELEKLPADDLSNALDLTREVLTTKGQTYMFEPNLEVNLKYVAFNLRMPLGLVKSDDESRWYFGNISLDAVIGHTWGKDMAAFGLSGGLGLYTPTASAAASRMAAADLWFGPKFQHGYLTLAPFISMGFFNKFISFQGHAELVSMHQTHGNAGPGWMMYMKYGGGLVIIPSFPLSIIGEINGMVPIAEADAYNALFGMAGLQLKVSIIKAALAAQFPIVHGGENSLGGLTGGEMSELAKVSLICRVAFVF